MTTSIAERLDARSIPEPNSGCILWTGAVARRGYGKLRVKNRVTAAHRVAYELAHGPVPPGMFVCHRCDVPSCINPAHLFAGTHQQNMDDMTAKRRRFSAAVAAK